MEVNSAERTEKIRSLNDKLRTENIGGRMFVTQGVQALPMKSIQEIMKAVREFDNFTEANDPYGEHDCVALDCAGHKIFFKIDYYDQAMRGGSPDPADSSVTTRVMTIMLAEEY